MARQFYVYILASERRVLYIGVTNDLVRRMYEHRSGLGTAFSARYRVTRLVLFEITENPLSAIAREKQLKGWRRSKKVALIEQSNPQWADLSRDW